MATGVLAAVQRPADYVERRDDGYREPELLFVVGTAHFSEQSADDVRRVVEAVQPENVVLEVCKSRAAVIYEPTQSASHGRTPNDMSLSGTNFAAALLRSARLGGNTAMLLRAVLSAQADRVSAALGTRSGVEMRAGRAAAERVGAQIVLGDRPIEITLQRAWAALSWRQRFQLLSALWQSRGQAADVSADAVEAMKDDDVISSVVAEYSAAFPEVVSPLLHERDMYLAWSLKRSKAVNGSRAVVGVVGKGHLRGVLYHLVTPDSSGLRFRDLVGSKNVRLSRGEQLRRAGKRLALEALLAGSCYAAWTAAFPPS
ncbi:TraB domain-containing protein [Coccomyxa sp. Obi]|nr:TraB domain-containing protein [Coccomyxa sp. Obi]